MLSSLHISHYVLIDALDVDFPAGLVIITGQTGAGKSILLGALSLLTGAKADASLISEGADSCVVEAEFTGVDPALQDSLEDSGVEWDDALLTVRRVVHRSGRSRSFVNDCPVPLGVLSDMAARLVDIHSQHQNLLLSDPAFQRSVLDLYAGDGDLLTRMRSAWREGLRLQQELDEVTRQIARSERERDYNEARYQRLADAQLREGEIEELEAEQERLAHAEQIHEGLETVRELLDPSSDERPGLIATLKEGARTLSRTGTFLPDAATLSERLDATRLELSDVLSELERLDEDSEASPQRLEAVEDRLSQLYDLLKKYDCRTDAELIAARDSLSTLLYDATALEERRDVLTQELEAVQHRQQTLQAALHEARLKAAPLLGARLEEQLRFLELDQALFQVLVEPAQAGETGADAVRFLFSATGRNPVDVARCASGGELSRVMLCLKGVLADYTAMPTLIFDEIDSGVSGSVADKMGSMICTMGERMQVLAITHLPQVAAKGQAHFRVSKEKASDGTAVSTIRKLSPEERVREIARLLSGSVVTDEALANARRLLDC